MNDVATRFIVKMIYEGNISEILSYIEKGFIDYPDKYGWTALMFASWNNRIEILKILISSGANMHLKNHSEKDFINLQTVGVSNWLETYDAQKLIISKDPTMFINLKNRVCLCPEIINEYDYLSEINDLNLI